MANKTYSIVINGLQESIKAVDALNSSLGELDKKIKALEGKAVKVGSTSSGGGSKSSSTGALSEEEKIQKQIEQLEEKRIAHSKEIYQNYLAAKDVLKEVDNDQKSIAATERLQAKSYSNTIQGMKQELADIKSAMQTVDLGDTDQLDKMTQRAKELNDSLKKIEESYGQFGRNVGNYAEGVAEGLSKVKINVGGTVREFDNAKQAAKELGNELKTMAVNGQQGTKEFKDLQKAVATLNSDIKDATVSSKAMDNLLDTMQSIASIGSITKGFSALFGFDDTEIEKSIQKLVALQNVMQGIEKLNQQMNTGEGIGGWLSKGNAAIDSFVQKLTGANKAQEALNASTTAGKTASEGLAAAETAQAAATSTATVATKALSVALKAIGIGLVISAIATLITYWEDIYKWMTDTVSVLKNLETWFEKIRAAAVGVGSAVLNFMVQPFATLAKIIKALIEGNFSEIPNIISNGLKKTFDVVGNYQKGYHKEIERQQTEHNKKVRENQKKANEELLKDEEAKYGQSHKRTQEYLKKQLALTEKGSDEYKDLQRKLWEDERREREENNKKSLASQKQANRDELEAQRDLNNLKIANMKEGLNKVLTQLEEERKQRLAKVEADGIMVGERQVEINKLYDKKIYDAKKEWAEKVEKAYRDMWDNIYNYSLETTRKMADLTSLSGEVKSQELEQGKGNLFYKDIYGRDITSSYGVQGKNQLSKGTQESLGLDKQINRQLSDIYEARLKTIEDYWKKRIETEIASANANYDAQLKLENESYQKELRDTAAHAEDMKHQTYLQYSAGTITAEQYYEVLGRLVEEHSDRTEAITKLHDEKLKKLEQDKIKNSQNTNANYYRERLQELRDFQTAISNLESKQPVYNAWGIYNIGETKKNNENLLKSYETLAEDIVKLKDDLQKKLDAKEISFDEFQNANRELDRFVEDVGQKMDKVKRELTIGDQIGKFIQSINQYVQAGFQAVQTVMNALSDYQDYQFDKEQEELDKYNEMLDKKLDEQQDIIEKHKSNVDSIEDELANSRGDRRQHLIDQLNAEISAQRAAQAEEKRIQKEKEATERKQEALEKKRREAEYKRNLMQIMVSTAMATANGLATQPFIPVGLAMGALATTLGMVQYALAKQQKPYAKGGQLEGGVAVGNRHRDGGIPVLGGRASIEGGEFITNRLSTANNIDLLEFINSKKSKVDVSDLIEFYSSGTVKKNISGIKTKFEDGGYIPTLPNSIDAFDDRLIQSFENYSNRPIYVTVTDIENRMEQVRYVRTLAGL